MGTYSCDAIALEPVQCCELPLPLLNDRSSQTAEPATELVRPLSSAAERLKLNMSRLEIANLLDTRIETVSRVL